MRAIIFSLTTAESSCKGVYISQPPAIAMFAWREEPGTASGRSVVLRNRLLKRTSKSTIIHQRRSDANATRNSCVTLLSTSYLQMMHVIKEGLPFQVQRALPAGPKSSAVRGLTVNTDRYADGKYGAQRVVSPSVSGRMRTFTVHRLDLPNQIQHNLLWQYFSSTFCVKACRSLWLL